ncbi:MAG TPA: hypothetical protein DCS88_00060 [Alphaproteobacteria bacterium]|nr:hypothetical protein [Alphaproteobacteria bacterium]
MVLIHGADRGLEKNAFDKTDTFSYGVELAFAINLDRSSLFFVQLFLLFPGGFQCTSLVDWLANDAKLLS